MNISIMEQNTSLQQVLYEVKDHILTITMNRPEKLNAINPVFRSEIIDAVLRGDRDDDVRVIIIIGSGRAFCAGVDLDQKRRDFSDMDAQEYRDGGGLLSLVLYDVKKPIIAAINGHAAGVGITMTLPMDIRVLSSNAKLVFAFARRGLVPEACSTWFLPRLVGMSKATEWCLMGKTVMAPEALESGLVNYVVPPEEVYPKALSIAREIAEQIAPVSAACARQLLWKSWDLPHPMYAHKRESMVLHYLSSSPDKIEGRASFKDKRQPHFSMHPSTDMPDFYPWWDDIEFPKKLK